MAARRPHPVYGWAMSTAGLEVRLNEGREGVEVARATRTLNEVVRSMEEIDRVYLLRATRATWVLADMFRHPHQLVVRLEPRNIPSKRAPDDMLVPVRALLEGASILQREPIVPPLFNPATVTRVSDLAVAGGGVQSVELASYNGKVGGAVELNQAVFDNGRQAVNPFEVTYGSVVGRVSRLVDLKAKHQVGFTVRQDATSQAVEGTAPAEMAERLRAAWMHRYVFGGKIRRNSRGQAIRISVDQMEPLAEDSSQRPSVEQLAGAVDWLGGLTVDQWISEVRGG